MKYASGRIQNVPTSSTRSSAGALRSNVAASPSAIAVAGIAHGSAASSAIIRRPGARDSTTRYAMAKQTTAFAAVAAERHRRCCS